MSKKELAIELAKGMKQIRPQIIIEETANRLMKGMTAKEMEKALANRRRNAK